MEEGTSGTQIKLDGYTCLNPVDLIQHLRAQGRPTSHFEDLVNRFTLPVGREYGRGSVLMTAWAVRNILKDFALGLNPTVEAEHRDPYRFDHVLEFKDRISGGESGSLPLKIYELGIVRVSSLTGFNEHHYNNPPPERSVHWVKVDLADARYIARYSAIDLAFNVRSRDCLTVGDTPSYYKHTLNGGTPWTWGQIISRLFNLLPTAMARHNLADAGVIYPTTAPENIVFRGMSAWDALCTLLKDTGNVIYRDALVSNWYVKSQSSASFAHLGRESQKAHISDPTWDYPMDVSKSVHLPKTVRVFFPTDFHYFPHASFADDIGGYSRVVTGKDAWTLGPLYAVDTLTSTIINDPDAVDGFFMNETVLALHSDLMASYDEQGNLLNGAALTTRANEMSSMWLHAKSWNLKDSLHTVFNYYHWLGSGFQPDSDVSAISWYNTCSGSKTEVLLSPLSYHPSDELGFIGQNSVQEALAWEVHSPPDVARHHGPDDGFVVCQAYSTADGQTPFLATVLMGSHSGAGITWSDSGKQIYVHPLTRMRYCVGDKFLAWWHQQTRRWITHRDYPLFAFGDLDAKVCPSTTTVAESQWTNAFSCEVHNESISLSNSYKLAGVYGDKWFAYRGCSSCDEWVIIQIAHHSELVVVGGPNTFDQTLGCTDSSYPPGTTVPNNDCEILYKYRENSVMYCEEALIQETLAFFFQHEVMVDWFVSGLCFYGIYQIIYVACACTPYTRLIICGVECTSSGGGGGGGTTPVLISETFVMSEPRTPSLGPGGPWRIP